jgi:hypothetical protein
LNVAGAAVVATDAPNCWVTDGEDSITLLERGPDNSRCKLGGSPLFALVRDGQYFHVRMGTLVDDPGIRPMFHIFVGSKATWHEITDSLPQYPRASVLRRRRCVQEALEVMHSHVLRPDDP